MVQQTDSQTKSQKDKTSGESQDENYTRVEWLICKDPVHIGGADSSSRGNNNPIFRLSDRTPAIPGSSLRGALREHAENSKQYQPHVIKNWFGGKDNDISTGHIALGWGWPVWWPVHVLGYGTWWVSCKTWLNRLVEISSSKDSIKSLFADKVYITKETLKNKTIYLRWLKLSNVEFYNPDNLGIAKLQDDLVPLNRRIIVPDEHINLLIDMGLVRQPRVSLTSMEKLDAQESEPIENEVNENIEQDNDLINGEGNNNPNQNKKDGDNLLFSVEGLPPGAVFMVTWTTRGKVEELDKWHSFLRQEHYLGGLWGIGYGRISITEIDKEINTEVEQ